MKKLFLKLTLLATVIILTSCSHSSSDEIVATPTPTPITNFINYSYAGATYSNVPEVYDGTKKEVRGSQGTNAQYKKISLWMPLNPTVGSHNVTIDPTNPNAYELHFVSQATGLYLDCSSGAIIITSVTTTSIEGTFSCSGLDSSGATFAISSGSFKCNRNE